MTNYTSPALISDKLLRYIKQGECVLFLGADLPLDYEGAPFSRPELANTLARKYSLPQNRPWPETVLAYLGRFNNDRNSLINLVSQHCQGNQLKSGSIHTLLTQIGFRAIVSVWYDQVLEQALAAAGYRVTSIIGDQAFPYNLEGEREVLIIKLYGCLSQPESLIFSIQDQAELMMQLSRLLQAVTPFFSSPKPLLFVNFDVTDFIPIQLYNQATLNMVKNGSPVYVVWNSPTHMAAHEVADAWPGVQFFTAAATPFLEGVISQLPLIDIPSTNSPPQKKSPYKYLDYYRPADVDLFFGRETESQIITRLATSQPLLIVYGTSGVGKTSLLLAGVWPYLVDKGYTPLYIRPLDAPLTAIRKAIAARVGRTDGEETTDLSTFLQEMLTPDNRLVIMLDQFEEIFWRVGSRQRADFFTELASALAQSKRQIHIILTLRQDYLTQLSDAQTIIPTLFNNAFQLTMLTRHSAYLAITEPARELGIDIESELVNVLVGSGGHGIVAELQQSEVQGDLIEADGVVSPVALQLVLDRIYHETLTSEQLPSSDIKLTVETYQTIGHQLNADTSDEAEVKRLQGAEAILADYLGAEVERVTGPGPHDSTKIDPTLADAILKLMITDKETRKVLTQADMLKLLDETGHLQWADPADQSLLQRTRQGLEEVGLLRGFHQGGLVLYELAHDDLVLAVLRQPIKPARLDFSSPQPSFLENEIKGEPNESHDVNLMPPSEVKHLQVQDLLLQKLKDWQETEQLLDKETLVEIYEQHHELDQLAPEVLELLARSALVAQHEVEYWFEHAGQNGVTVLEIVQTELSHSNFRVRVATITALEQIDQQSNDLLTNMLADDYPQVRFAAIMALHKLAPDNAWQKSLKRECFVPPGNFVMGDKEQAHQVYAGAFYIAKYLVTNADYKRFADDTGLPFNFPPPKIDHPVTKVSWHQARQYAEWANMRLVTEAEWEKAASWYVGAGGHSRKKNKYPWGDNFDQTCCNTNELGLDDTTPVGHYSPQGDSPYACADMVGNVWEWTSTLYADYPYWADDGREHPQTSGPRVRRGGAFNDDASTAKSTTHHWYFPSNSINSLGFRVGFSPPLAIDSEQAEDYRLKMRMAAAQQQFANK